MPDIQDILDQVVNAVQTVPGVSAIVLGGSRARGTHQPDSDTDIGIYYRTSQLDLPALETAARRLDDSHQPGLIAPPGEWGKWVNGGGWLIIAGQRVDFILRDFERVENIVAECEQGIVTPHYQTGHPHAYLNVMYRGELAVSRLLWDATGEVTRLKAAAEVYPPKMKAALIQLFSFEAGFSGMFATTYAQKDDAYYVMAHMVRSISSLNQVLFALNEQYCLNEKKAVRMIESFPLKPPDYKRKIDEILAAAGQDLPAASARLESLVEETRKLIPDSLWISLTPPTPEQ